MWSCLHVLCRDCCPIALFLFLCLLTTLLVGQESSLCKAVCVSRSNLQHRAVKTNCHRSREQSVLPGPRASIEASWNKLQPKANIPKPA